MRFVWRRMPAASFDHELVWLAVSLATLASAVVWMWVGLGWPRCPFLAMTGWPCMTCGGTRATMAFLRGDFLQSLSWNPLAFLALVGVAVFDLYAVIVLLGRAPRLRMVDWTRTQKNILRIAIVSALLLNWMYLLAQRGRY
jgi:hypothetical protein